MGTIYAIANQKGGVGKTTTAVNVAACIAAAGYETLVVDVDPQGNATVGLGVDRTDGPGVYEVLSGDVQAREPGRPAAVQRLSILASSPDLAGAAVELPRLPGSEPRLRAALAPLRDDFAFILLDCPPSLGPLTVNAPSDGGQSSRMKAKSSRSGASAARKRGSEPGRRGNSTAAPARSGDEARMDSRCTAAGRPGSRAWTSPESTSYTPGPSVRSTPRPTVALPWGSTSTTRVS